VWETTTMMMFACCCWRWKRKSIRAKRASSSAKKTRYFALHYHLKMMRASNLTLDFRFFSQLVLSTRRWLLRL
jgi:hypothetical protein